MPLISMIVFMPVSCSYYVHSSIVQFEIGEDGASSNSFIILGYLSILGSFVFPYKTKIFIQVLWRTVLRFWWGFIQAVDCFQYDGHFYYINLTDSWVLKNLLSSDVIFNLFHHCLNAFIIQFFTCLVRLIPKIFVLFCFALEAIVKGIISLISSLIQLSILYMKATGFCMLILYPTTLLKVLIICKNFLLQLLRFLLYHITC